MTPEEIRRLNCIFVDQARGCAPVIAGVISDTTDEAVAPGLAAKEAGAVALQVIFPHLFQPAISEIEDY